MKNTDYEKHQKRFRETKKNVSLVLAWFFLIIAGISVFAAAYNLASRNWSAFAITGLATVIALAVSSYFMNRNLRGS